MRSILGMAIARRDEGATAIEYGLIASVIAIASIAGMTQTGTRLDQTFCYVADVLGGSTGCTGAGGATAPAPTFASAQALFSGWVNPQGDPNTVVTTQNFFGRGATHYRLDQGGGVSSDFVYYDGLSSNQYERIVTKDGLIVASQRDYVGTTLTTVTQYQNTNGAYDRRVEFNQATGEVMRTEYYHAGANIWSEVAP